MRQPVARIAPIPQQPVLFAQRNGANAVLDWVVVNRQVAGFGVATERKPAFQTGVDGFAGGAIGRGAQARLL